MLKALGRLLNIVVWAGFAVLLVVMFIIPLATTLIFHLGYLPDRSGQWWLRISHEAQWPIMQVFCVVWIFFVGSCFASFLNVVAWRVPRGKSILGSSTCPQCKTKLKFPTTNIPVLGWLKNGGKCASCNLPIPVRYLIAELILGFSFLLIFLLTVVAGGLTIPFRPLSREFGFENVFVSPQADLLVMAGFHLTLVSIIFTLAIAATEKFRAPVSLVVFGVIASVGFQGAPLAPGIADYRFGQWENGVRVFDSAQFLKLLDQPVDFSITLGLGVAAAGLCFLAVQLACKNETHGVLATLVLLGIFLGWQAVISTTIFFLLFSFVLPINACGRIFLATLIHLCLWRLQSDCQWWPGPASSAMQLGLGVGYVSVLAVLVAAMNVGQKNPPELAAELENEVSIDLPTTRSDLE